MRGGHPAAWREPGARPTELLTARYWTDLVVEVERGLLDFVTIEDSVGPRHDGADRVQGRLDAVLTAARVAPHTRHVGLVPAAVVAHTEPFHVSKAIATLDHVSSGRAGWQVRVATDQAEADQFGRRDLSGPVDDLFDEAADHVEVVRRWWDSWEDDAEIRDTVSGRFLDRDMLHRIDFAGRWFSVAGPSITPRPPQGQPVVVAVADSTAGYRLAARAADVVVVKPGNAEQVRAVEQEVRAEQAVAGRALLVFGDLVVFLDEDAATARDRKARLDDWAGSEYQPDAAVFTGTPGQLADLLVDWANAGLAGFRLRPGAIPDDLVAITSGLVPRLQERSVFRRGYEASTLRGLLGLPRPASRYTAVRPGETG